MDSGTRKRSKNLTTFVSKKKISQQIAILAWVKDFMPATNAVLLIKKFYEEDFFKAFLYNNKKCVFKKFMIER